VKPLLTAIAAAFVATLALGAQTPPLQQYGINDPVLRMRAWTLTAPANWNVEGTLLPSPSCAAQTSPIYRALSPDGTTGVYFLPRYAWAWGGGIAPAADCLPFSQALSARQFLAYYIKTANVGFIRHAALPQYLAQMSYNSPSGFLDTAIDVAGYTVNGRTYEEYLQGSVACGSQMMMGIGQVYNCSGTIKRGFAPRGKLEAFEPTFEAMRMQVNPAWNSAWANAMAAGIQNRSREQTSRMLYQGQLAGEARMADHQAYMATVQAGYDLSNQQFSQHEYQKQNNKENEVDFILGCQRILDPDNRQIATSGNCPNRQTPP
jgi:hypothetical protein